MGSAVTFPAGGCDKLKACVTSPEVTANRTKRGGLAKKPMKVIDGITKRILI